MSSLIEKIAPKIALVSIHSLAVNSATRKAEEAEIASAQNGDYESAMLAWKKVASEREELCSVLQDVYEEWIVHATQAK